MEIKNLEPFLISPKESIISGMKKIDSNHSKILFVVDKEEKMLGSLSDGDIRRWILSGKSLNAHVSKICNSKPIVYKSGDSKEDLKRTMIEKKIGCVPFVNHDFQILDLLFWSDLVKDVEFQDPKPELDLPVVIMAGGIGNRLQPFTQVLPKPLIPIGDKTIIERIIDNFREYKINKFYVTYNDRVKILKYYLEELNSDFDIEFIKESKPLGTAGSLKLMAKKVNGSFLVTNCDILINSNYNEIVSYHNKNDYDITLVSSMMNFQVPYGTCELDSKGNLTEIKEKPEFNYLISTGMYVLNSRILKYIPKDKFFHITDLIERVNAEGGSVGVFPISENSWQDTGQWKEYRKTVEQFKKAD